jgi:hypothetical protein
MIATRTMDKDVFMHAAGDIVEEIGALMHSSGAED